MVGWLEECRGADLIVVYRAGDECFLEVKRFRQQKRAQESKFPAVTGECVADATQALSRRAADAQLPHTQTYSYS